MKNLCEYVYLFFFSLFYLYDLITFVHGFGVYLT